MSISNSLDWGISHREYPRKREEEAQQLKPELSLSFQHDSQPPGLISSFQLRKECGECHSYWHLGRSRNGKCRMTGYPCPEKGDKPRAGRCSHSCTAQVAGLRCHFKPGNHLIKHECFSLLPCLCSPNPHLYQDLQAWLSCYPAGSPI